MIALGGLHGNEPMGVWALQRVLERLHSQQLPFRGQFIALAGNRAALRQGTRYVDVDLNRIWTAAQMEALDQGALDLSLSEHQEQAELTRLLKELLDPVEGSGVFLDLHTSSSPSAPFGIVGESQVNRAFALSLKAPVPLVFGLDAQFDGPLLKYVGSRGHRTLAFEAGQHADPTSIDLHEAMTWLVLASHAQIDDGPWIERCRHMLAEAAGDVPRFLRVFYRHGISARDGFVMEPGFCNFHPVERGQLLARQRSGEVVAPEPCRILLPLYQNQGNDGFFLARELPLEEENASP